MGISGLYKVLEDVVWPIDLRNLSKLCSDNGGKKVRVAIDGNVWIAKACHTFAVSMAVDSHQLSRYQMMLHTSSNNDRKEDDLDTKKIQDYVYECSQWVCDQIQRLCLYESMDIIVVLDGKTPPLKQPCSHQRKEKRQQAADTLLTTENVETRIQLAKRSGGEKTTTFPLIVGCLLELLESHTIPVLVAPYEADAQLMYLSQNGYVDVILTEDSDLYLTCPLIFTKYESHSGTAQLLRQIDLGSCTTSNLLDISPLQSILIMIAAGCDYCSSLPGIGIRTAIKVIQSAFLTTTTSQCKNVILLPQIFQELYHHSSTTTKDDHEEYELQFMKAIILFRHAIVFCPIQKQCIMMNHPQKNDPDHLLLCQHPPYQELFHNNNSNNNPDSFLSDIIGTPIHDNDIAISIATGKLNPKTNQPYPTLNNNNDTSMEDSPLSPPDGFHSQPDHTSNTTMNLTNSEAEKKLSLPKEKDQK